MAALRSLGSAGCGAPTGLPWASVSWTSDPLASAPAAEGRESKYRDDGEGLAHERRADDRSRRRVTSEPLALSWNRPRASPVMASG